MTYSPKPKAYASAYVKRYLITGLFTSCRCGSPGHLHVRVRIAVAVGAPWSRASPSRSSTCFRRRDMLGEAGLQSISRIRRALSCRCTQWLRGQSRVRSSHPHHDRKLIRAFRSCIRFRRREKTDDMLQTKPSGTQRVVLIDFPSPELKSSASSPVCSTTEKAANSRRCTYRRRRIPPAAISRSCRWKNSSRPTGAADQAMAFILSAGAVAPEHNSRCRASRSHRRTSHNDRTVMKASIRMTFFMRLFFAGPPSSAAAF